MEWTTIDTCYEDMICRNEVAVLSRGIRATIEIRYSEPGRLGRPVFYIATLGGAELGRFPTRELAKQHLVTAGKAELQKAIQSLDELAQSAQKQVWR